MFPPRDKVEDDVSGIEKLEHGGEGGIACYGLDPKGVDGVGGEELRTALKDLPLVTLNVERVDG